jgi:hypothetical protein
MFSHFPGNRIEHESTSAPKDANNLYRISVHDWQCVVSPNSEILALELRVRETLGENEAYHENCNSERSKGSTVVLDYSDRRLLPVGDDSDAALPIRSLLSYRQARDIAIRALIQRKIEPLEVVNGRCDNCSKPHCAP